MKQFKRIMNKCISVLTVAALVLLPAVGCSRNVEVTQTEKNVKVTTATKSSISINVEYAGKVKPLEEITIASKLPGKVELVKAAVGSEVQKGDLLFKLDTKAVNAQLNQSKAAVDNAQANLARVQDSSLDQQIIQLEAAVKQAQIQYDDAKRSYDKIQQLYGADAASKQQLDDAESYLKNAEVQLNSAQDNLKVLREKAAPQTTAIAATQLEQAQAAYEAASIQVSDSTVTAPISGVISMRNVDEGEFVGSGTPAFTVINSKTLIIEISVPDTVVAKLHTGQQVPMKITATPQGDFTGTIDAISPAADPATQAYTVKLRLENPDNAIKPGMLAKVILPMESKADVITVPNEAIFVEDGIQYVFLAEAGKVKKTTVSIGLSNDKVTEVTGGLSEGASIITEGQSFLNDGENVNVIK